MGIDAETATIFLGGVLKATVALLIVVDPVGLLPFVVAGTRELTPATRRRLLSQAVLVGLILLLGFTLLGVYILELFRITLEDFQIAGGILLLVIALTMVTAGHWGPQREGEGSGLVPLATPLLTGPGAITTSIVMLSRYGAAVVVAAIVITFGLSWLVMQSSTRILRLLGDTGSDVVARIMGMLLAAIAVQYIREGIQAVLRG